MHTGTLFIALFHIKYGSLQLTDDTIKNNMSIYIRWCKLSNKLHKTFRFKNKGYGTKSIGLPLIRRCSLIVLAISIYKHHKTYPKVSPRIYLPKIYIFVR